MSQYDFNLSSGLTNWLQHRRIVKTEAGARRFLCGFILFNFIVAALIFYFFVLMVPTNGVSIIHDEAVGVYHLIEQNGWSEAILFFRMDMLFALGNLLGALYALKLPLMAIAATLVFMVMGYLYRAPPRNNSR